jgi:hypothetical protein
LHSFCWRPLVTGQHPEDTPWKIVFDGWHIDPAGKTEIDAILKRCIVNPVSSAFIGAACNPTQGARGGLSVSSVGWRLRVSASQHQKSLEGVGSV